MLELFVYDRFLILDKQSKWVVLGVFFDVDFCYVNILFICLNFIMVQVDIFYMLDNLVRF